MNLQRLLLTILAVIFVGLMLTAHAEDEQGSSRAIEALLGQDQHGLTKIEKINMPQVAKWVQTTRDTSPPYGRALHGLAISGYSPESTRALIDLVEDVSRDESDRTIAAMGLMNFTSDLSPQEKDNLKQRLRKVLQAYQTNPPSQFIHTLVAWNDAEWVLETLGPRLHGNIMETAVLENCPTDIAIPRLLKMYAETEPTADQQSYFRRSQIGWAVVKLKDKRGIDILATLLPKSAAPDTESGNQSRNNVFRYLMKHTGRSFGYEYSNYHESLEPAIERFKEWWAREGASFSFPEKPSRFDGK